MDRWRRNATLFQINAVTWAGRLAHERGEPATLFDIPDSELDQIAALGFDLVWLMGVWQRGPLAVHIALNNPHVPPELTPALPDWTADDVIGSPFAVQRYVVDRGLGGDAALASLRSRLAERGLGLILDFIPNHVARDHSWVFDRPEFLVTRDPEWVERDPERFFLADTVRGARAVAYGKDPHFVGWIDTAQLDYRNPALRNAMCDVLREVASRADGARCDMAMLVFDDVFSSTWPEAVADHPEPPNTPFWPAAIDAARSVHPQFLFIAEVYWAMEGRVLENGFDYAYDKAFYDRLKHRDVGAIQQAVRAPLPYLSRTVHFIENHDEEPAITAFPGELTKWAATLSATLPGLRFFHEGQFDGRTIRLPVQLGRPRTAHADPDLVAFYERLLHILSLPALRDGDFHVVDVQPEPAIDDAGSPDETFWNVLAYHWRHDESGDFVLVVANLSGEPARATVPLAGLPVAGRVVDVVDLLHSHQFPIDGNELIHDGLSVSLAPFVARVISFQVRDAAG